MYVWVDAIHTGVRLGGDDRLCSVVIFGARPDGKKELVAIQDGYREYTKRPMSSTLCQRASTE